MKREDPHSASPAPNRRRVSDETLLRNYARTRDPRAREQLIERFMPLARSLAWRYAGRGESLEDLIQVASEGLVRAVDGYDPDRGVRFRTYATPTILGVIRRHFRDFTQPIHMPRGLGERIQKLQTVAERAGVDPLEPSSIPELARRADLTPAQAQEAVAAIRARRTASLNRRIAAGGEDGDGAALIETIGERERGFERVESTLAASRAGLDSRESSMLRLRFGRGMTQREVGAAIGASQMQISRMQRQALNKLLEAVREPDSPVSQAAPRPLAA